MCHNLTNTCGWRPSRLLLTFLMSFLYAWASQTGVGAFPTFHFLFVIFVSFPFLFSLSLSVCVLCVKPPWSCLQDRKLKSDWRNGVPVKPAPVIRVCVSPPTITLLLLHTVMCLLFVCEVSSKHCKMWLFGLRVSSHNLFETHPNRISSVF